MPYTFSQLCTDVFARVFAEGQATNLLTAHTKAVIDALIDLQQWVECLQFNNTSIIPACNTFYSCGVTGCDAPRGRIKKVSVIDSQPQGPLGGADVISGEFDVSLTGPIIAATSIGTISNPGSYLIAFNVQNPQCGEMGVRILTWNKDQPEYVDAGAQYFNVNVIYTDASTNKQQITSQILPFAACNQTLYATVNIAANTQVFVVIVPVNVPPATGSANITVSVQTPASYVAPEQDEWCSEIEYVQTDPHYVQNYFLMRERRRDCSLGRFFALGGFDFDLTPRAKPARDIGVAPGLAPLPLGYHYAQADTDKRRRARSGLWALERQNIYVIPWIQSTEKIVVKWDGIKRTWGQSDPVDQDPLLIRAVTEFVRADHARNFDHDYEQAGAAEQAYAEARANLIHECKEETRVRSVGEPSFARAQSTVLALYYNDTAQTATASCPAGQTGSSTTSTVAVATVSSTVSVADANSQALQQAQAQAQAQLNCSGALMTYWNTPQSYTAQCTTTDPNAPAPTGNSVTVNIPANTYSSNVSQADANQQALSAAQSQAESEMSGNCTWSNSPQSFTATCPSGQTGTPVTITIPAGQYTSTISQQDANNQALTAATNQANSDLICDGQGATVYYNTTQQACVNRNVNCNGGAGEGGGGGQILFGQVQVCVTVAAGTFSSTGGVAAANAAAYAAALAFANSYPVPTNTPCNSTLNVNYP
jgi:hypothetical protein